MTLAVDGGTVLRLYSFVVLTRNFQENYWLTVWIVVLIFEQWEIWKHERNVQFLKFHNFVWWTGSCETLSPGFETSVRQNRNAPNGSRCDFSALGFDPRTNSLIVHRTVSHFFPKSDGTSGLQEQNFLSKIRRIVRPVMYLVQIVFSKCDCRFTMFHPGYCFRDAGFGFANLYFQQNCRVSV